MPSTTFYSQTKYKTRLSRAPGAADTTLYVEAIPVDTVGILVIDKDSDDNYEIISYAAVAGAGTDASPYTLTGCVRGLASSGYSLAAGTGKAHGKVEIGCADAHYFTSLIKRHLDTVQTLPQSATTSALPTSSNTQYDLRWVQAEGKWYYWSLSTSTGATTDWLPATTGTFSDATEAVKGATFIGDSTVAEQATGGADANIYGTGGTEEYYAQSYIPTRTEKINQIVLSLKKTASPTDNITVSLYSDTNGNPGSLVATTAVLAASGLTTSYVSNTLTFASEQTLTGGTRYHFRIERSGSRDAVNFVTAQYNSATDRFPYGGLKKSDSSAWSAVNYDLVFELRNSTPRAIADTDPRINHVPYYGVDNGTKDGYVFYNQLGPGGYSPGMPILFRANTASTGAILIEDCEDAWNESVAAGVTATADASVFKVGSNSSKLAVDATVAAGTILATEAFTALDISAHDSIAFWIQSSVAVASGDLQLLLDDSASCASPLETLNIPALEAGVWKYVTLSLAAAASDTALVSVGVKYVTDVGAVNIYIDDIRAVPSVNINGYGPVALKKHGDLHLSTGDIRALQFINAAYDNGRFEMTSDTNPITTKGDLEVGTGSGETQRLAVGTVTEYMGHVTDSSATTGTKWNLINRKVYITTSDVTVASNVTKTAIATFTLPANLLSTNNGVILRAYVSALGIDQSGDTCTIRLEYGSTVIATHVFTGNASLQSRTGILEGFLASAGTTSSQEGALWADISDGNLALQTSPVGPKKLAVGTAAEDSTADKVYRITVEHSRSAAGANITVSQAVAILIA